MVKSYVVRVHPKFWKVLNTLRIKYMISKKRRVTLVELTKKLADKYGK
jgi:hypothetical protein